MAARASQLFLPTLREDPADAEAVSHKLLVRGGFVRQVGAGLWTYLPLGWRIHRKVEQIIREEMDAIGAQEFLCPLLTPIELWQATGRDKIPELFHVTDRNGRQFLLPFTHEETFTFHAREIRSYRELPQLWYHFSVKDRDEPRPRGGLLRVREFIMKDAYSFDRDTGELRGELRRCHEAYHRIFERCGLEAHAVRGGERDHGRRAERSTSSRRPDRARTLSCAASAGTTPPTPRSRGAFRARRSSRAARGRRRRSRRPASRPARRSATFLDDRSRGDVEGDAGHDRRRQGRPRARSRRRPAERVEAALGAEAGLTAVDRRRDPRPRSARRAARSARSASPGGSSPTRRSVRASSSRVRTATASISAAWQAGRDFQPRVRRHPRAGRGRPLPGVRRCAHVPDRDRGRTHLQLRRQVQQRPRRDVPRRGRPRRSRCSAEATESAQDG